MTSIGTAELRDALADVLERVAVQGERVVLEREGAPVAAIVCLDDLRLLEELEDRLDLEAARAAIEEMRRTGEKPISLEEMKKELGMT